MDHTTYLYEILDTHIKDKCTDKKVGCAFSGGIDSLVISHLAKKYAKELILVTVNDGSKKGDYNSSINCAEWLDVRHDIKYYTPQEALFFTESIIHKFNIKSIVDLEVALIHLTAGIRIKEYGCDILLSGDGSDSIFGAYNLMWRIKPPITNDKIKDLKLYLWKEHSFEKHLIKIAKHLRLDLCVPYHDHRLEEFADIDHDIISKPKEKNILIEAFKEEIPHSLLYRNRLMLQKGVGSTFKEEYEELLLNSNLNRWRCKSLTSLVKKIEATKYQQKIGRWQ